ncbi:MAG TPA: hypothetical protein VHZ24_05030 [Pirellulales bacterium]|nr:hypothetical protein [Pirellulales bacterium]
MQRVWYRHDQQSVVSALRQGRRPEMATTTASGRLDKLVGLHEQLGILAALDEVPVERRRHPLPQGVIEIPNAR